MNFLSLRNADIRYLDQKLFSNLSFSVKKGESWALLGPSGSGKSALLAAIAGKLNITGTEVSYGFHDEYVSRHRIDDPLFTYQHLISYVPQKHHFKNLSNTSDFYYQQRYNSEDSEDAMVVKDYLTAIKIPDGRNYWTVQKVTERLHLTSLLDKQLIKLSNGETRRLLIAASLLRNPLLLLLDSPFTGLDTDTRKELHSLVNDIVNFGITVIMATSPSEIPEVLTHVAILDKGQIINEMHRSDFKPDMVDIPALKEADQAKLHDLLSAKPVEVYNEIISMRNVNVRYGDVTVLRDVNWVVKQGEAWALMGHNGAGKSTLLSLVNGDNPQAYSNDIFLFDRKRGSGESIWDIKSKTGYVSPEMLQYFATSSNCLQVVESGFYDTMGLFRASSIKLAAIAMQWMELIGIQEHAKQLFKKVPASVQRLCLLARALVKNPPLLILDEPCQGLDEQQQRHFKELVDSMFRETNLTLIYVTHYQDELPDCIRHTLKLSGGSVVN
ncbi:ATP-binding cassette domain-containing protein [Pedobacter sp. HMF7647]|uniref:ATP-binding cassette domain-containing protein n=1 Tax=Hufsiella arboris TaxID=2695275 RepID=A0A7K1YAD6_9SPHI|nr:ATP-binding cassette domain-containing protein [Hufsiella arboris]MXV51533.1 ATP-binding cassette domain-containing protein [Hufsiella arboris]